MTGGGVIRKGADATRPSYQNASRVCIVMIGHRVGARAAESIGEASPGQSFASSSSTTSTRHESVASAPLMAADFVADGIPAGVLAMGLSCA